MPETKTLEFGDACPNCGSELKAVPVPSDDEYRKAFDRENPVALKTGSDTASPDVRKALGALYRCENPRCQYQTRFTDTGNGNGDPAADEAGDRAHEERTKAARSGTASRK